MSNPHLTACLLALTTVAVLATPPVPTRKAGYEGYSLVQTRNIFDPERMPGVTYTTPVAAQAPPPTAADYAALTGTMLTADKALAFFAGSRPEFNKVLAPGGMIAGATLKQITPNTIEVEREGKRTTVTVGQTVPLNASSVPGVAPAPATPAPLPSTSFPLPSSAAPSTSASPPPTLGSADREALMRRMMEKRQQELK